MFKNDNTRKLLGGDLNFYFKPFNDVKIPKANSVNILN